MKIYNEDGRISEDGKKMTADFTAMVNNLVATGETAQGKRLIGSILASIVGDITSNQATQK